MVSIWQGAMQVFVVGFPPLLQSLLFWVFAALVVHVCQQLVEHTAYSVDPSSRRISASHAALCIGSIVWALDVVGLFMYAELSHHVLKLVPALSGLVIMVVSARLTIPTLSTSASKRRIALTSAWLALGALAGHFTITSSHVQSFAQINGLAIVLSLGIATGISCYCAIRHRAAKLSVLTPRYRSQTWADKLLCGGAILVLHWLLVNTFAMHLGDFDGATDGTALLFIVLVFAMAVALEHLSNLRSDAGRQQLLRRGLSMMRTSAVAPNAHSDIQQSLIADHLDRLLHPDNLALHFQPIIHTQRNELQLEALLRLTDTTLGRINPETFLLVCELQGKTAEVDRMILCNALDNLHTWRTQGLDAVTISVNVAPVTLMHESFAPWLGLQLAQRALPPRALKLEMTEHAIIALGPQMVAAIRALSTLGVAVLMDDFGAGYSSLGMLAELPIAGIKCDRLFVRQLPQDRRRQKLLRHISALARDLGLSVVVEGVETPDELRALAAAGLHHIQGYLFSHPIAAPDVPTWYHTQLQPQREALLALLPPTGNGRASDTDTSFMPTQPGLPWAPGA
ncbi:EAL domain-containing protein [Acidovorax sp. D2M1]|uniref:EAL domain-containing protein n=1 Tax=Acidovorax benzenivorans TaxID=2987520 RepID=A0ABT5RYU4_9BURK|nr:EAL domain-containing protein [Acidovorax benzenivorans]MDD2178859.1 EAL domain-containing protein [Acidovorax benzenivorans]